MRRLTGMLLVLALAGCGRAPAPAEIESVAMEASQRGDTAAERRLAGWAGAGLPVAQRELALLYQAHGGHAADEIRALLEAAAHGGDTQAAFQLGELERARASREGRDAAGAAAWYRHAAEQGHAKAALMLALLYKNGDGVARDLACAVHWLSVAAKGGDAHAMFLLSNAYASGEGIPANPRQARVLLERAADHEYPAAIQQLALVKETGDALTARDETEARQLLQEGAEHRRSNARRF